MLHVHFSHQDHIQLYAGISTRENGRDGGKIASIQIMKCERTRKFLADLRKLGIVLEIPRHLDTIDVPVKKQVLKKGKR